MNVEPGERAVLNLLAVAQEQFDRLPGVTEAERFNFGAGVRRARSVLAVRVAVRADPELWGRGDKL